nr:CopG family transcriptional regulator [Anabaena azotica]
MNRKWSAKRITVNLTSSEVKALKDYCSATGRPATDVIRELIRSLERSPKGLPEASHHE